MYYLQSRYYNPEWGRFINEDSIGGKTGELLSHNIFAYCKNNPVSMSDPDGTRAFMVDEGADPGFGASGYGEDYINEGLNEGKGEKASETVAPKVYEQSIVERNPNGRNGCNAHQNTIKNIEPSSKTSKMRTEYKYVTPNGSKSCRYADKVEIKNGEVSRIYQVGKVNMNGLPVIRESRAIADIMNSPDYNGAPIYYIPYNSTSGPIIFMPY